jgi:hypothetical protein
MSGLHEVQTGSGRLAGKVAIVTGTFLQRFSSQGIVEARESTVRVVVYIHCAAGSWRALFLREDFSYD